MSLDFIWKPDVGAKRYIEPDVTVTKFNGYESRTPNSINSKPVSWQCTFSRSLAEIELIEDFLMNAGAVKSFFWTDPKGYRGKFVCRTWDMNQQKFGVYVLSAKFDEVFE